MHGTDTLSYFKLRSDKHYLWSDDGSSFLGYRIENGVLLVSGDPVATREGVPELIGKALDHAELHSLRFGIVGASGSLAELCRAAGLTLALHRRRSDRRSLRLLARGAGDPEGTPVGQPAREGRRVGRGAGDGTASPELLAELDAVSAAWLGGDEERGFSMALDKLGGEPAARLPAGGGPRAVGGRVRVPAAGATLRGGKRCRWR